MQSNLFLRKRVFIFKFLCCVISCTSFCMDNVKEIISSKSDKKDIQLPTYDFQFLGKQTYPNIFLKHGNFSPNNKFLALQNGNDVFIQDTATRKNIKTIPNAYLENFPIFTPDGSKIFVVKDKKLQIFNVQNEHVSHQNELPGFFYKFSTKNPNRYIWIVKHGYSHHNDLEKQSFYIKNRYCLYDIETGNIDKEEHIDEVIKENNKYFFTANAIERRDFDSYDHGLKLEWGPNFFNTEELFERMDRFGGPQKQFFYTFEIKDLENNSTHIYHKSSKHLYYFYKPFFLPGNKIVALFKLYEGRRWDTNKGKKDTIMLQLYAVDNWQLLHSLKCHVTQNDVPSFYPGLENNNLYEMNIDKDVYSKRHLIWENFSSPHQQLSPDGKFYVCIADAGQAHQVKIIDTKNGHIKKTILINQKDCDIWMQFSPTGKFLVINTIINKNFRNIGQKGEKKVCVYNTHNWELVHEISGYQFSKYRHIGSYMGFELPKIFTSNESHMILIGKNIVSYWDTQTWHKKDISVQDPISTIIGKHHDAQSYLAIKAYNLLILYSFLYKKESYESKQQSRKSDRLKNKKRRYEKFDNIESKRVKLNLEVKKQ
jgi:hypothetical protein